MRLLYSCDSHRPYRLTRDIGTDRQAAEHFAAIKARRRYGKSGRCEALSITGWSMPGPTGFRSFQVSAFIGYPNRSNRRETTGGDVHFTVYVHSSHEQTRNAH